MQLVLIQICSIRWSEESIRKKRLYHEHVISASLQLSLELLAIVNLITFTFCSCDVLILDIFVLISVIKLKSYIVKKVFIVSRKSNVNFATFILGFRNFNVILTKYMV